MSKLTDAIFRELEKQLLVSLIPSFDIEVDQRQREAALKLMQAHRQCLELGAATWDEVIAKIDLEISKGATKEQVLG